MRIYRFSEEIVEVIFHDETSYGNPLILLVFEHVKEPKKAVLLTARGNQARIT